MAKERIPELDILRAVAILAVIMLHAFSAFFTLRPANLKPFILTDQFLRFCVPLFVAISGYTLGLKYLPSLSREAGFSLKEFLTRRVLRIFPLYLFWSAVLTFFIRATENITSPIDWKNIIIFGQADYHLYFVPMIFQLYILFPLILFLYKKSNWVTLAMAFLYQFYLFWQIRLQVDVHRQTSYWLDQKQYFYFGSWIFYFVLGLFLVHKPKTRVSQLLSIFILVLGYFLAEKNSLNLVQAGLDPLLATRFTRFPIMIYSTGFILTGVLLGYFLLKLPKILISFLSLLGRRSYLIYLGHTLVLRYLAFIFEKKFPQDNSLFLGLVVISLILIVILTELFQRLTQYLSQKLKTFNFGLS